MRALLGVLCLALGCGGEVEVIHEHSSAQGGAGASSSGGPTNNGCARCGVGDCGMCVYDGGAVSFACRGSAAPVVELYCTQTGNLFHDETGSYVCWRCK